MMADRRIFRSAWSAFWTRCRPQPTHGSILAPLAFGRSGSHINRFSPEEDATIVKMRKDGNRTMEIASVLGRSYSSVHSRYRALIHRLPDAPPIRKSRISKQHETNQRILQALRNGRPMTHIAREMGMSAGQALRRFDYVCAPGDYRDHACRPYTDAENQTIVRGTAAGSTLSQIALELGRSVQSVRSRILSAGMELPKRRDARHRLGAFTAAKREQIRKMKQNRHSWEDIAVAIGRTVPSVIRCWDRLFRMDPPTTTAHVLFRGGQMTIAEREKLIRLFDQGLSRHELAAHFKRRQSAMCTTRRRSAAAFPSPGTVLSQDR